MNINNAYPSKWLTSADIPEDADLALTIKTVSEEKVGQGESEQSKPVIYFQEVEKGMVCNKTNATTISNLYGPETDNWLGKRIALFATEVDYQGKQTLAIRVRLKAPKNDGTPLPTDKVAQTKPTDEMWQKWNALWARAHELNLDVEAAQPDTSAADLAAKGRALRALLEKVDF